MDNPFPRVGDLTIDGKFDRGVSMLAWAYNEEMNVEGFVERAMELLDRCCEDYELVLIDDASTDRTLEIARELQARYPALRVVHNERNMNSGWNTRIAIQAARKEFLFWQTVDWSYDITHLRHFLELLKHYDVVQGVRVVDREPEFLRRWKVLGLFRQTQIAKRSDNFVKAVVSVTNYLVVRTLFGMPLRDYQNVTFYPTALIQSCHLEGTSSFVNPECLLKAFWKGRRFKEVPIGFLKREKGEAKGTRIRAVVSSIWDIVVHWHRWVVRGRRADQGRGVIHAFDPAEWTAFQPGTPTEKGTFRTPTGETALRPRKRHPAWTVLKVGLMIGLIVYLLNSGHLDFRLLAALGKASFLPTAAAVVGLFYLCHGLIAIRQMFLLRHFGLELGWRDSFHLVIIGAFFNNFLPGSTGGDLVRLYYLGKARREMVGEMAGMLLADRLFGVAGLALLSCAAIAGVSIWMLAQGWRLGGYMWLLAGTAVGVPVLIVGAFLLMRFESLADLARRRLSWLSYESPARGFLRGLRAFSKRRRLVAAAVGVSVGVHLCSVLCVVMLTDAMLGPKAALASLVSVPLVMIAGMAPFTPGNVGWTEYVGAVLFGLMGAAGGATVLAVWRVVVALLSLPGGVAYLAKARELRLTERA